MFTSVKMDDNLKRRIGYAAAMVLLIITEVMIALYVHDDFVRPYVGDMLVVIAVYCAVRIFIPVKCKLLPLYVFIFAGGVELLQYFDLVGKLGLENNIFLRTLLGSVFDVKDIVCYAVGCIFLGYMRLLFGEEYSFAYLQCYGYSVGDDSISSHNIKNIWADIESAPTINNNLNILRNQMKKKKLIIIFIIFAMIISFPFGWYYAIGPRVCSDGVSNERCLYYRFHIYHSMYSVDYYSDLEKQGIVLKKKIGDYMTEWYYLATDEYGDEVIVADYIDYSVVYKK